MRWPLGQVAAIFGIGGSAVMIMQLFRWDDEWRLMLSGFVVGVMLTWIVALGIFHGPKRDAMLEKERKKAEIVQLLPSRTDRLEQLWSEIEQLDLEIANMKVDAEGQGKVDQSMFYTAPEWMKSANQAGVEKKQNELFMKEQAYERLVNEQTRVYALTDAEWRAEQETKIHVPE